jgi:hypothetical protein
MSIEKLLEHTNNIHMAHRYLKFINHRINRKLAEISHMHHILPKAKDMFPEFKDLKKHPWNGIKLTPREHFIAHWMLAKIFPKTSQSRTFYYMVNNSKVVKSKDYELARLSHIENMKTMYTPDRNQKISNSLRGRKKSPEHIEKLSGHKVSDSTKQKLREHNLGKKHTIESRQKMSKSKMGVTRGNHSSEGKTNISNAKKISGLKWYNNGSESKLFSNPPLGWVKGRLKWIK